MGPMIFRMSCLLVEMPAVEVVLASWIDETNNRMSSISLMGSIVAVLGETYIGLPEKHKSLKNMKD